MPPTPDHTFAGGPRRRCSPAVQAHTRALLRSSWRALAQRQACSGLRATEQAEQGDPLLNGYPLPLLLLSFHPLDYLDRKWRVSLPTADIVWDDGYMSPYPSRPCRHGCIGHSRL
jgi:hypothetical protein